MKKREFYKEILNGYFTPLSVSLENFCEMLKPIIPIFGTLKTEIKELENGNKEIIFIDESEADIIVGTHSDIVDNKDLKFNTIALRLTLDKNGVIILVENGIVFITPANKNLTLFLGSLIHKKIEIF